MPAAQPIGTEVLNEDVTDRDMFDEPAVRKVVDPNGELGVTLAYSPSDDLSSITKVLSSDTRLPTKHEFTPGETLITLNIVCLKPGNKPRLLATYAVDHKTGSVTFDIDEKGHFTVRN